MRKKGQGAFEYILLIGGTMLVVLVIAVLLRQSYGAAGAQVRESVAAAIRVGSTNLTPAPTTTGLNCSGGYLHATCLSMYPPKYCENGAIRDNCQTCGCPAGLSCTATGTCAGGAATPTPVPSIPTIPAQTPRPTKAPPAFQPFILPDALALAGTAVDSLIAGIYSIGDAVTGFLTGLTRLGWVLGLIFVLALMAVLVYYLSRAHK